MIAIEDPLDRSASARVAIRAPVRTASAIAKETLERLFRDQLQPRAYACYVRALGTNAQLAGTVQFQLRMGRGEVSDVTVTGLGDAALDACLVDAAYSLGPPMPDFTINADDQTVANYPLTFKRHQEQAIVILGDADSESPIDFDAIHQGIPTTRGPITPDATTPLGSLRPTQTPSP